MRRTATPLTCSPTRREDVASRQAASQDTEIPVAFEYGLGVSGRSSIKAVTSQTAWSSKRRFPRRLRRGLAHILPRGNIQVFARFPKVVRVKMRRRGPQGDEL